MNFFQLQDDARKRSRRIIAAFVVAVFVVIAATCALALMVGVGQGSTPKDLWAAAGVTALATLAVILLGMLFKFAQLAGGGEALALQLGGRRLEPNTWDLEERRLINVVQEMALAAGIPAPSVFVMDHEEGINAFAAGLTVDDAVVGVTRGCLTYLSRDELQGIIGHEFSHILNGDMRINLRLIALLNGILVIYYIGWFVLRSLGNAPRRTSRSDRDGGGSVIAVVALMALGLIVIGSVGFFCGQLLKAGCSRQREFLADASSAQFTRNPEALAGALRKIGGLAREQQMVAAENAEEASHMFFARSNGSRRGGGWFATHPALDVRIRKLDPAWDGTYPENVQPTALHQSLTTLETQTGPQTQASRFSERDLARLGALAAMLENAPEKLRDAAEDPFTAEALILAMTLHPEDDEAAKAQFGLLAQHIPERLRLEVRKMRRSLAGQPMSSRFALAEAAIPGLRLMSLEQYRKFREYVELLVRSDGRMELNEYIIQAVVIRSLDLSFALRKPAACLHSAWNLTLQGPVRVALSRLAFCAGDAGAADAAFTAGCAALPYPGMTRYTMSECSLAQLDTALRVLDQTTPLMKQEFLRACRETVTQDATLTPDEIACMFAICGMLGVPFATLDLRC